MNAWRNRRCGFRGGPNEQPRHRPLRTAAKWRPPIRCPSSIQSCCIEPTLCPPKPTTSQPAFIPRPWQAPGYRSSFQISEANKKQQQLWGTQFSKANCVPVTNLSFTLDIFIHPGRNVYESQFLLENFFFLMHYCVCISSLQTCKIWVLLAGGWWFQQQQQKLSSHTKQDSFSPLSSASNKLKKKKTERKKW